MTFTVLSYCTIYFITAACSNYTLLTDSWRRITGFGPSNGKLRCDQPKRVDGEPGINEGWHRFSGAAGTHLPTEQLDTGAGGARGVCGTDIVAWMRGSHPHLHENAQPRDICFEWDSGPCQYTVRILVQTCPDPERQGDTFYVYQLKYPPGITCYWAYCAF